MSTASERREKQIIAFAAADPSLTHTQLADLAQCSTKTIQRILQRNAPTIDAIDDKLQAVQGRLKERLPIEKRVEIMANIAESSPMDFAKLGAVKYINELDDIHPALEREKARKSADPGTNQPMFALAPGMHVSVTINQQNNTISSEGASLHKTPTATGMERTPTSSDADHDAQ